MPIKSKKQYNLMRAASSGKLNSDKTKGLGGPSQSVAKHFLDETSEDKKKKFARAIMKRRGKK